jgi:predicted naringenin-chalcone synthase
MNMPVLIAGIGTAVPPHRIVQSEAAELARRHACETPDHERVFNAVYWGTGVQTRHSVVLERANGDQVARQSFYGDASPTTRERMCKYEEEVDALAIAAARRALADARVAPKRVTHLVTVSCTGFSAPGFDIALIKKLGLSAGVARTQVGFMGCHGALNGLRVAQAFVAADPAACVLLCAVEMCSLHHQYGWNAEQIVANSLFADGAGAVVLTAGKGSAGTFCQALASGSTLVPESEDAMSWRIGDHGFQMTLSTRIPDLIAQNLRGWLDGWLEAHGLTVAKVGSWAVHPGGPRILAAVGEALGIDRAALAISHTVLAEYGNMSSPTVLFILERMRQVRAPRPWVALGFGPGLAVEALLLG